MNPGRIVGPRAATRGARDSICCSHSPSCSRIQLTCTCHQARERRMSPWHSRILLVLTASRESSHRGDRDLPSQQKNTDRVAISGQWRGGSQARHDVVQESRGLTVRVRIVGTRILGPEPDSLDEAGGQRDIPNDDPSIGHKAI